MARTSAAIAHIGTLSSIRPYMVTRMSGHFVFHYVRRSQWTPFIQTQNRPPIRLHGVHSTDHVDKFSVAFEESWKYYAKNGWNSILKKITDRIPVFFLHIPGKDGRAWAWPVRIDVVARHEDVCGPTNQARVEATAAHELFHVLQAQIRPKCFDDRDDWAWFSEATAAFMETQVFPKNREYLCYLYRWFDEPELSLEFAPNGSREYGSLIFCRFLRDKFRTKNIIRDILMLAGKIQNPLEALQVCLGKYPGAKIPLASPIGKDLFANEFLVWNFFLGSRRCAYRDKTLLKDKFQHAFAYPILRPNHGQEYTENFGELGPLAGRYHLIKVPKGTGTCKIKVELSSAVSTASPGKAIVHAISNDGQPIYQQKQIILDGSGGHFSGYFKAPPSWLKGTVRLILLIMANVSFGHKQAFIDDYTLTLRF